jgi:hypothetical protein
MSRSEFANVSLFRCFDPSAHLEHASGHMERVPFPGSLAPLLLIRPPPITMEARPCLRPASDMHRILWSAGTHLIPPLLLGAQLDVARPAIGAVHGDAKLCRNPLVRLPFAAELACASSLLWFRLHFKLSANLDREMSRKALKCAA